MESDLNLTQITQDEVNFGKLALISFPPLPATFHSNAFHDISTGILTDNNLNPWESALANEILKLFVSQGLVQETDNGRYGISGENQAEIHLELTENGFITEEE